MKAITIKQPWATLIAIGAKKFETRSWKTNYRGSLAIHASKKIDKEACRDKYISRTLKDYGIVLTSDLPTGSVIAIVKLIDCHQVLGNYAHHDVALTTGPSITGLETKLGDYTEGRYAWELSDITVLDNPVQAKGQLSLWQWEASERIG